MIVVVARRDGPLQQRDFGIADRLVADFTSDAVPGAVLDILSHRTEVLGKKLVSPVHAGGQASLIILELRDEFMAVANMELMSRVQEILQKSRHEEDFPEGLELGVTGSAALGSDMLSSGLESIRNTERTAVLLVIAILLVVYRAPGLVIVPLVVIFVSLAVSLGLVTTLADLSSRLGCLDFMVFKLTRIFIVVVLFGAGTDFCLFLIARYKEELGGGLSSAAAIGRALGSVGHVIAASAMTTILGLGMMAFAEFGKSRNGGPTVALCLAVTLVASVTLAPALLRLAGPLVFWPFGPHRARKLEAQEVPPASDPPAGSSSVHRFWEWLSGRIVAYPGLILGGSLLLLSPLAYHGFGVEVTYDLPSELQPARPSIEGMKLLQRYFPPGETGPITVLAYRKQGDLKSGKSLREKVLHLSQRPVWVGVHRVEWDRSPADHQCPQPGGTARGTAAEVRAVGSLADGNASPPSADPARLPRADSRVFRPGHPTRRAHPLRPVFRRKHRRAQCAGPAPDGTRQGPEFRVVRH